MQEGLSPEHSDELLRDPFEHLLNSGRVADKRRRHLQTTWGNVANGSLQRIEEMKFDKESLDSNSYSAI